MAKSKNTEEEKPKKKYAGRRCFNADVGHYMHRVAEYRTFYGRKVGIYSDAYDFLIKHLAKRIRTDQQNVIMVEGETGSGKSAFCLNLCLDLARELKCGFDLERDYIYSATDLWNKLKDPDANPINFLDEGTVTISSSNAMQKSDKQIATLMDTMRSKHWTTIIASPSHLRINSTIRRDHAEFKIKCYPENKPLIPGYGRGFFECRHAKRFEFKKDEPQWLIMFAGIFGDYPPMLRDEYLHIKAERQKILMDQYISRAEADEAKANKDVEKYIKKDENLRGEW